MDVPKNMDRILRHLRDLIEGSDVPRRVVDRRLGHAEGYLSQLLAGSIDLKYRHLIDVLEAIGCPPQRFFERAFPLKRPDAGDQTAGIDAALAADKAVAGLYSFGIEGVCDLRLRLERCEKQIFGERSEESGGGASREGGNRSEHHGRRP